MVGIIHRNRGSVFFASILVLIVALSAAAGTAAAQSAPDCSTVSYDGDGSEANPYEVGNVDQLQCIEEHDLGANYVQVSDIDASETMSWNNGKGFNPIDIPPGSSGTTFSGFTGTFDGQDHKITNLTIDRGKSGIAGLFGAVGSGGKVTNVSVVDVNITGLGSGVGGLVGANNGTVARSHATGLVNGTSLVGGLVGSNDGGTVTKSYATAEVDGSELVGGLVGGNGFGSSLLGNGRGGEVTESYATGSVNGSRIVGGLLGGNNGTVTESYAAGAVNGSVRYAVGGLVVLNEGTVEESYWDVNETGQTVSAGNGTGLNTSEMTGSAARGNMTALEFTNTWKTVSGGYPVLAWQTDGGVGSNDSEDAEGEGLPGFTVVTALLALLTVVAAASRQRTK